MAYQTCERQYARLLAAFDLSIAQFDVLNVIDELGDQAAPAQIAQKLVVTKGNISGLLKRLADPGWIAFSRHEHDGRSFVCRLKPKAVAVLAQARQASAQFITLQLSPFSDAELAVVAQQMDVMRAHLERIDPELITAPILSEQHNATKRSRNVRSARN